MNSIIKRNTGLITSLMLLTLSPAQADFLGVYAGAGSWKADFTGNTITTVSLDDELALTGNSANTFYVALEHPVPMIPNIKLARASISDSGTGNLATNFSYGGTSFTSGQSINTTMDLTYTDLTLYYELIDIGIDLDAGVTARQISRELSIDVATTQLDVVLPMLYLRGKVGLPLSGLYFGAEANFASYSDNSVTDYAVKVGWGTENFILPEFGIELGFRSFVLDTSETVNLDLTQEGVFVNLEAHF